MAHGDDNGLVLPPALAPTQVVIVAVREDPAVLEACQRLDHELNAAHVRTRLDDGRRGSFGRRVTDWEMKGVPVRVEVGPRDLAQGLVTVVRRDSGEKTAVPIANASSLAETLVREMQVDMLRRAREFRDARTTTVGTLDEAIEAAQDGFARVAWEEIGEKGEVRLKAEAMTVRCLQRADATMPLNERESGLMAIIARSY